MPIKYCPSSSCGERFTYSVLIPPIKCPSCGFVLAKAFASIIASVPAVTAFTSPTEPYQRPPIGQDQLSQFRRDRSNDPATSSRPAKTPDSNDPDDQFDSYEVQANARLIAGQVDAADFSVTVEKEPALKIGNTIKIISLPTPPKAAKTAKSGRPRKVKR